MNNVIILYSVLELVDTCICWKTDELAYFTYLLTLLNNCGLEQYILYIYRRWSSYDGAYISWSQVQMVGTIKVNLLAYVTIRHDRSYVRTANI